MVNMPELLPATFAERRLVGTKGFEPLTYSV